MPLTAYSEPIILDQILGGGQLCQLSTALTAGQTAVTSLACSSVTTAETLTNAELLIVSFGTSNAEVFTVSGTPAAGSTTITVSSQTSKNAHSIGDVVVRMNKVTALMQKTWYLGLSTATSTSTTAASTITASEVSTTSTGYARQSITNNATQLPASTGSLPATKANANSITFPTATGNWGTVASFFIADASTSGNVLLHGPLSANQTVNTGNQVSFAASALSITLQ